MSDAPPIAPPPGFAPEPDDAAGQSARGASRAGGSNGSNGSGSGRTSDRVQPHSLEAEVSVLGSCLISTTAVVTALEMLGPDDFYRNAHRIVFESIQSLSMRNEPIDAVTVTAHLSAEKRLEEVGGAAALYDLTDQVPTAANASYYAKIVRDKSLLRRLIEAGTKVAQLGFDSTDDAVATVDRAETLVYELARSGKTNEFTPLSELLNESFKHLEVLSQQRSEVTGLATGFDDLDRLTAGLQRQNLIILAARPAMGKSGFALGISRFVAAEMRKPVMFFSLEMSKSEIVNRLLSAEAGVDSGKLRTGRLTDADWRNLADALGKLSEAPLYIDDTPSINMMEIRAKARRLKQRKGLELIVVDYLQLMESHGRRSDNRVQEVAEISRGLKMLAKDLDVPVIALSQLSRQTESRTDKRPMLSDLRESGSIEQDADIVGFIYRDEVYDADSPDKGIAEIIISKHRNGATNTVRLAFLGHLATFANLARTTRPVGAPGGASGGAPAGAPVGAPSGFGGPSPV
jgi:replicative DNA helicase